MHQDESDVYCNDCDKYFDSMYSNDTINNLDDNKKIYLQKVFDCQLVIFIIMKVIFGLWLTLTIGGGVN